MIKIASDLAQQNRLCQGADSAIRIQFDALTLLSDSEGILVSNSDLFEATGLDADLDVAQLKSYMFRLAGKLSGPGNSRYSLNPTGDNCWIFEQSP